MRVAVIRAWFPAFLAVSGMVAIGASAAGLAGVLGWLPLDSLRAALGSGAPSAGGRPAPVVLELEPRRSGCTTCGVVEAIRPAPGGQLNGAEARRVAAAGEARPGTRVAPASYRITVRMDDGSYRTLAQPEAPTVAVGDAVRIADGTVAALR